MEFKAKKSLGQNFLKSRSALASILKAGNINSSDTVIEVGPGKGVLTEGLLEKANKVIAVEKDDRLIEYLKEKFKNEIEKGNLEIIHQDVLQFNPEGWTPYKLIANIPYYITGQLIRKFLESNRQPERMVLMLQKEVAKRIVGKVLRQAHGKESILSLSVKAYGTPKYIETVPARYFSPAPKVDSAILLIEDISKKSFGESSITEKHFFNVVKAGLSHKRKLLIRNLEQEFKKETIAIAFQKTGIDIKSRGEDLTIDQWMQVAKEI